MGRPAPGYLPLLHRLEQGRLGLGGSSVDLVRQQDLGEDRALAEFELLGRGAVDVDAGDVRGQKVRRELQALERAAEGAGQRLGQHRLAHTGDVFDQEVAPAQEGDHAELDFCLFANQHAADVLDDLSTKRLDRAVLHLHPSYFLFGNPVPSLSSRTVERQPPPVCYRRLSRRAPPAASPPIVPPVRTSTSSTTRPTVSSPADPSGPTGPIAPASSSTTIKPTATMTPFQAAPPRGPINPARKPPASNAPTAISPRETTRPR